MGFRFIRLKIIHQIYYVLMNNSCLVCYTRKKKGLGYPPLCRTTFTNAALFVVT